MAKISKRNEKLLVEHFMREFNYSDKEAREAIRESSKSDLEIHLDAAKHGYI